MIGTRKQTFKKRKVGLFKKAYEYSILMGAECSVLFPDLEDAKTLHVFSSSIKTSEEVFAKMNLEGFHKVIYFSKNDVAFPFPKFYFLATVPGF